MDVIVFSVLRVMIQFYFWKMVFNILIIIFFFFNDTATTEIYTLSLHDALPIYRKPSLQARTSAAEIADSGDKIDIRSEEHTSELQSQSNLVCRLLLEKKKHEHC